MGRIVGDSPGGFKAGCKRRANFKTQHSTFTPLPSPGCWMLMLDVFHPERPLLYPLLRQVRNDMAPSFYTVVVAPILGWLAVVSLFIVGYLIKLEIAERRRNRRMNEKRIRLGLTRIH